MLLPRYRTPPAEPGRRRLDTHLAQIEHHHTTITTEIDTLAPLDTIDQHRRGIPIIAPGIPGTAPGTNPLSEVLRNDRRPRYILRNR